MYYPYTYVYFLTEGLLLFYMHMSGLSCSTGTTYTDFLKDFSKRNQTFVAGVEKALTDLVTTAQKVGCILRAFHSCLNMS